MNYSDTRFTLDVQLHQAQVSVSATLNDTARRLCVGFTDGRKPYVIAEGCTATFAAKKPDGLALFNACTVENNTIIYEFTPQTTNVIGTYECEIRLYNEDGKQLTSPRFLLVVDEQAINDDDVIDSFTEVTMLNQIIANESERIVKENERITAEEKREQQEIARMNYEASRDSNESTRQDNEETRKTNEETRISNESARISNESTRQGSEEIRQANESERIDKENKRIAAEKKREDEEIVRANEEASRNSNESTRISNENTRRINEDTRRTNEDTRISNEYQRIANESAREARIMFLENRVGNVESFAQFNSSDIDKLEDFLEYTHPETDDNIFLHCYPIGSIYMSVNSTSPASLFGGTWTPLKDRFLVGAGSAYSGGATGGETSHSHNGGSLTALMAEDGKNTNIFHIATRDHYNNDGNYSSWNTTRTLTVTSSSGTTTYRWQGLIVDGKTGTTTTLPPYLAVYMWERTA